MDSFVAISLVFDCHRQSGYNHAGSPVRPTVCVLETTGTSVANGLFYDLGRSFGPKLRKARWIWASMAGSQADRLRLEYQVGLDLCEEVHRQTHVEPDRQMVQVLADVGSHLTAGSTRGRRFQFEAYDAAEPNAFALPGGFVFVSGSILRLCLAPTETVAVEQGQADEVAFVVAHEMGHILHRHAIERIAASSAILLARRVAPAGGALGAWLANTGVRFLETAYSRSQELEADQFAVRLSAAAGYQPQASIQLLSRLAQVSRSAEASGLGQYFSTHPAFNVRIDSIRQYMTSHPL
jgi:predicted Zn-dependent protease